MLKQLKQALVDSFVGAIALGWLFAQGLLHFTYIFTAPLASWVMRKEYSGVFSSTANRVGFTLQDSGPELAKSFALLLLACLLLRWLYFKPTQIDIEQSESRPIT